MTMIERVARAIGGAADDAASSPLLIEFCDWSSDDDKRILAIALLEALREPSEAMRAAVMAMLNRNDWHIDCGEDDIWRAMIDGALLDADHG